MKEGSFGVIVEASHFISDINQVIIRDVNQELKFCGDPQKLSDLAELWSTVLKSLIDHNGDQASSFLDLQGLNNYKYKDIPDVDFEEWLAKIRRIKNKFTEFLSDQLHQEKESLFQSLEQALEREKTHLREGITAPNECMPPRDATDEELQQVTQFYQFNPVREYEIDSVEIINNPASQQKFAITKAQLNERAGNPVFNATWENIGEITEQKEWRRSCYQFFSEFSAPFKENAYPNVNITYLWHGTTERAFESIKKTGYVNLATTDPGFFGDGIYGTIDPEYAYRVYANGEQGVLLINRVATFSVYFQIKNEPILEKREYKKYDARFVFVSPRSSTDNVNYDPCHRTELPTYAELVVSSEAACIPLYRVKLRAIIPPRVFLAVSDLIYQIAEKCENSRQPLVAYYYFTKAKQHGNGFAQQKMDSLSQKYPEYKKLFR